MARHRPVPFSTVTAVAAVLSLALLTGCGSSDGPDKATTEKSAQKSGQKSAATPTADPDADHDIVVTDLAGDMRRDLAQEKTLATQLAAAKAQFKAEAKDVAHVEAVAYDQADADRGPTGPIVFLGAKLSKDQDPEAFVKSFSTQAAANGFTSQQVSPGPGGGKAVCAAQNTDQKVAICAWATHDTLGELVPTVPGYTADQVAKLLVGVREDVEQTT